MPEMAKVRAAPVEEQAPVLAVALALEGEPARAAPGLELVPAAVRRSLSSAR